MSTVYIGSSGDENAAKPSIFKRPPNRVLIIAVPGIGDVLLATPVIRSIKTTYPASRIDVLVPEGRAGMLEGNPDIDKVLTFVRRPKLLEALGMYKKLFRRYDLAVSTSTSDRYFLYLIAAAPHRASLAPPKTLQSIWKYWAADAVVELNSAIHTLVNNLQLIEQLGIAPSFSLIPPSSPDQAATLRQTLGIADIRPHAIVHPIPGTAFKLWNDTSWQEILAHLSGQGLVTILTGSGETAERELLDRLAHNSGPAVVSAAGRLSFAQVAALLEEAVVFIGTDTSTAHLSAAVGTPTIALFGPTSPRTWSPWPKGWDRMLSPFDDTPGLQCVGNVTVICGHCLCRPFCSKCKLSEDRRSRCLVDLTVPPVLEAVERILGANLRNRNFAGKHERI